MRSRLEGLEGLVLLREVMACLRAPVGGCPWDLEQDFASILPYTIEEAYEVADAIERGDMDDLKGELGDLLLQVVYHAQMADEAQAFDLPSVVEAVSAKMIRRHPHVFGPDPDDQTQAGGLAAQGSDGHVSQASEVTQNWEAIKAAEHKTRDSQDTSALADVGLALPALLRAEKMQRRAARVGFDWPDISGVKAKVQEELGELAEARATNDSERIADEFGDLMFTLVNWGRRMGLSSEEALRKANAKFERRFRAMEREHDDLANMSLDALEEAWQAAKATEPGPGTEPEAGPGTEPGTKPGTE